MRSCDLTLLGLLLSLGTLTTAVPSTSKLHSKLPSFVKVCHRNDPQLNVCARNSVNSLKERLVHGIPELYIPPMEPLVIPEIRMDQDTGAVYVQSTYKNVHIYGMSNFSLTKLDIDPATVRFTIVMHFPNMSMQAQYDVNGKIMMMPIAGSGVCSANFTDVELRTIILGERQKKNGRTYLKANNISVKYELGTAKLNLKNLFSGDNAMGDPVNSFINENWDSLSEELRPMLEKALSEVVRSSTDKLFKVYSYDDLLPE